MAGCDLIEKARGLTSMTKDDKGKFVAAAPTVQRMRDFLGEVRRARLAEEASVAPNDAKIRNYNQLASTVEKAVGDALPNDTTIAQATAVSRAHHDLFSRGTIADLLAARARGDTRFQPDQSIEMLMSRHNGLQDLADIPGGVRSYSAPNQGPGFNTEGPLGRNLQGQITRQPGAPRLNESGQNAIYQMQGQAEDSIRGLFRQTADESGMDPKVALKWIDQNKGDIKAMAGVSAELDGVGIKLRGLIDYRKEIERSALARFSEMDPQKAVQRIWNSANPEHNALDLIRSFKADPDALGGFQAQVLDEFLARSKMEPRKMVELLGDPKTRRLLEAVLPPDHMGRLERMVNIASKIDSGDETSLRAHFKPTAMIIARIFGAGIGRRLSALAGSSGTLQGPAILAQYAKTKVGDLFKGLDAKFILAKAIRDPAWEQFLLSREPQSIPDAARANRIVKRLVRTEQGARETAQYHLNHRTQDTQDNANEY